MTHKTETMYHSAVPVWVGLELLLLVLDQGNEFRPEQGHHVRHVLARDEAAVSATIKK